MVYYYFFFKLFVRQNGGWIPINKNLWSLSFVLVMGGSGMWLLSLLYALLDVVGIWNGAPFVRLAFFFFYPPAYQKLDLYWHELDYDLCCIRDVAVRLSCLHFSSFISSHLFLGRDRFPFSWYVAHPTHINQLLQHIIAVGIFQLIAFYMYVCDFFLNV